MNDPIYGFVHIPFDIIMELIEHKWFQRLRRIKQLGLSYLVYPGAQHTRFQHVIGAMSITHQAIEILKSKGVEISAEENEAVCAAVLLHDMGHGPYSHALEKMLIGDVHHEVISLKYFEMLNSEFDGRLNKAIKIFTNTYEKKFLHQLVSSQLDMDRLDYLRRDSFYTGVQEGTIGNDRIINMLNVVNDELVIDEKGIYSVEKFLVARRLMYWQVYLHKTVLGAEKLLVKIIERAKFLASQKIELFCTPALHYFLYNQINRKNFDENTEVISNYSLLDDDDISCAIKVWSTHEDKVLSTLCKMMKDRELPKVILQNQPFPEQTILSYQEKAAKKLGLNLQDAKYFVYSDSVENMAYNEESFSINILLKNGMVTSISEASDQYNIESLTKTVTKHYLCFLSEKEIINS